MLGIIDVQEWQSIIDLATAKPVERDAAFLKPLQTLAEKFPYPGDLDHAGTKWVMAAAGEIVNYYHPRWLFLSFTQPFFSGVHKPPSREERKATAKFILEGIARFARVHHFSPLIIGSGGLAPLQGHIVIPGLKGNLQASPWSNNMAGLYKSEPGDEKLLSQQPQIRMIIRKDDFIRRYQITDPYYCKNFPDYLLIAADGWVFKGAYSNNRPLHNIEKYNEAVPVYSEIGPVTHVEKICGLMEKALAGGKKVLLALVEGLGAEDFSLPCQLIGNCRDWYAYASYSLYYTLVTGKPFFLHRHPPIFDHSLRRGLPLRYPLSFADSETARRDSLGYTAGVPTAAVSSRSLLTHSFINADLTLECYTRGQANMGVLVAVNEERYHAHIGPTSSGFTA